ncbi:hypothetical protein [Klebsiella pneumoniae]|uniref:hypothetical protein n=1 Tax=Klebsiella pneumoniae TaxID=573 RepID=UPI000CC43000|nr:hypothetical protein [Klebsiella pneumoniae]PLC89032.1 hypothetical protein B6I43_06505 [Klebsiella pneumoniae]
MTITLQAVNELIASLESAGELSIREQKFLKLAKAFKQLAAENVALKESRNNLAEFIHEELDADYPLNMNLETPATDRIVAGIKADGVALAKSAFEMHIQSPSCYQDEMVGMESAISIACQVESQLREGADK